MDSLSSSAPANILEFGSTGEKTSQAYQAMQMVQYFNADSEASAVFFGPLYIRIAEPAFDPVLIRYHCHGV